MRLELGTKVRVDIPYTTAPDFEQYHGRYGIIVATVDDNASELTGDDRDNVLYHVEFDDGEQHDFRWRDLRPTPE